MIGDKAMVQKRRPSVHVATWKQSAITSDTRCIPCLLDSNKHNKDTDTVHRKEDAQRIGCDCPTGLVSDENYVLWQSRKVERCIGTCVLISKG